ncbi:mandelate racemase/muconate lactonizing enzyme family protein [Paenibacillus cremeus]|uniref:mandelate racemase/muconate lactonizing enzyme family protein n=1 Tax=Paenibacillus cremeus TaxID=2163881 RepID=UPI00164881C1|nr:mandelate racemase/muconate lactonizing enzyme family protein [Paenibacillus cremeus]
MKITGIEAKVVKVSRELQSFSGTAGTPGTFVQMAGGAASDYGWTKEYSSLYSKKVESLMVKITTDTGIVGWGEAQVPVGPEAPQALVRQVLSPILLDQDPLGIEVLWFQMYNSLRGRGHRGSFMMDAIGAVDTALWDIAGKHYGQPVYRLLGGAFREGIPLYHSGVSGTTASEKAASAQEAVSKGYKAIKVYIGKGLREDIAVMKAIREAVGDDITLMADALWMYNVHDALRLGAALEKLDVALLEAPTVMEDVQGHAQLTQALKLAVAQGETERTRYQFLPYLKERALDVIQPDIGRTGISEGKKIVTLAETFNIPAALHMAIGQCVYVAASAHVATATPNLLWLEMNPVMLEMANRFQRTPWTVADGMLKVPDLPGLGIEIDEEALQRCVE